HSIRRKKSAYCSVSNATGAEQALNRNRGRRFWDHAVCALTCTLSYTMSKTADQLILRPFSQDSPGSVSTGETPRQKMSKVVAPRDTKPDSAREINKE